MKPLAPNETRRQIRYDYTKDERIEKATKLGEALNRYASTEAELSRIKKDYGTRLDGIQAEIDGLNNSVLSGYELREYICFWTYDEPRAGRKTLRKREGGDIVAEEDMTEHDRQMVMEIIDSQAAAPEELAFQEYSMPTKPEDVDLSEDEAASWLFDSDASADFSGAVHLIFTGVNEADDGFYMRDDAERDTELRNLFLIRDPKWLDDFSIWLRESDERVSRPGFTWLADAVRAHLRGEAIAAQAAAAKAQAAKTEARKGRRAGGAGTVDVPSDEGSRDDAGADSKNDL